MGTAQATQGRDGSGQMYLALTEIRAQGHENLLARTGVGSALEEISIDSADRMVWKLRCLPLKQVTRTAQANGPYPV